MGVARQLADGAEKAVKQSKLDVSKLIELAQERDEMGKGLTHQQMADELGVSRPVVTKALAKIPDAVLESVTVEDFKENRPDIFASLQQEMLKHITPDKIKKASIQQLITAAAILYDKERLARGESTENVAVLNANILDENATQQMKSLIRNITEKQIVASQERARQSLTN